MRASVEVNNALKKEIHDQKIAIILLMAIMIGGWILIWRVPYFPGGIPIACSATAIWLLLAIRFVLLPSRAWAEVVGSSLELTIKCGPYGLGPTKKIIFDVALVQVIDDSKSATSTIVVDESEFIVKTNVSNGQQLVNDIRRSGLPR